MTISALLDKCIALLTEFPLYYHYLHDHDDYEQVYQHRFNDPGSYHFDFVIEGYPAFYGLPIDIQEMIDQFFIFVDQLAQRYTALSDTTKKAWLNQLMVEEIVATNTIEGVACDSQTIQSMLNDDSNDHQPFRGLINGFNAIQNGVDIPLDKPEDIRHLYDQIMYYDVTYDHPNKRLDGSLFRKGPVYIIDGYHRILHQGVLPEEKIIERMEESLHYLNDPTIDIIQRISIFHYLLSDIHPFYDGNGRIDRFISSYLLAKHIHPLVAFHLSKTILAHCHLYYSAFQICEHPYNRGDLSPFILMMLTMLLMVLDTLDKSLSSNNPEQY